MIVLAGGTGALVPSDETDIVNHLTECEKLRLRRAKIEEIRARMRELEESSNEEGGRTCGKDDEDGNMKSKKADFFSIASNLASDFVKAAGSGCKSAPGHGVFRLANKTGKKNIYKYVSGDKLGWKLLNKQRVRESKKIYRPDNRPFGKAALVDYAGTALLAGAVAFDAHSLYTSAKQDYEQGTTHNTVHTAASIAGSWTGSIQGASYGAVMGSAVPVVGSLAGGVIGGIVGGTACEYAATKLAETLYPAPTEKNEEETSGHCAICHVKLAGFDAFHDHFVEVHQKKLRILYAAVVKRAGAERADIEDPWFFCKAFVTNSQEIWRWTMEAIRDFNDHILMRLGWDIEKEEMERKMKEKELEEQKKLLNEEDKKQREMAKYRHSGLTGVESFILFGKVTSVVSFVSYSYFSSMKDHCVGGLLRI